MKMSESDMTFIISMAWMSGLTLGSGILFVLLGMTHYIMLWFAGLSALFFIGTSMACIWRVKTLLEQYN